jgi:digeranylgeranylglycerophospholipid reductase
MITVIGAGPSGNYFAHLLSKKGYKVQVFEENRRIGIPVQCTGLISEEIAKIAKPPKECILNRIKKARIISPGGAEAKIELKENLVVDRAAFDLALSEKAALSGAEYYLNTRFEKLESAGNGYLLKMREKSKGESTFRSDYVIGSDGPLSAVAKQAGLFGERKFFTGIQVTAKYRNDNEIVFYLQKGGLSWIVPLDGDNARIGVAFEKDSNKRFNDFMKKVFGEKFSGKTAEKKMAGLIPKFSPFQRVEKGNIFLLGDAAGQVKATTLGGIVPGMKAAEALSSAIEGGFSYTARYLTKVFPDLYASFAVRRIIDRSSPNEIDRLVSLMNEKKVRDALLNTNRDHMLSLGLNAVINEPKLLYFLKRIL